MRVLPILLLLTACGTAVAKSAGPVKFVDPFIGTQGDGNTFPGAAVPFGMVKLGPDCGNLESNSGYRHDGGVSGFSHTHVSGTGGGCKYGNIRVVPFASALPEIGAQLNRVSETASPGYFAMTFDNGIEAEMTVTPHAAIHRYSFGDNAHGGIMVEAGSLLGRYYGCGEAQNLIASEAQILSPTEICGFSRQDGGWNIGGPYTVYFYACFDRAADSFGTWAEGGVPEPGTSLQSGSGKNTAAYLTFGGGNVELRVGISYISVAQARRYCETEVGARDFTAVLQQARQEWDSYLSRVKVQSTDTAELTKFYTALYHTMLQPTDKSGENPLWLSDAPYYDDFYCLWDTFRTSHPLYTLVMPERAAAMVNSLTDIYRHTGYMPDGRSGDSNGRTQGGSNADMVVAEAILKDLPGIDVPLALEAMIKDAEADPGTAARRHGRGGLPDYKRLGYVSTDYERSGVRTLEYCANDYAIALALEKTGDYATGARYRKRASNWQNLWRDIDCDGISGFIMPRKSSGEWDVTYREPTWDYYVNTPEHRLDIVPHKDIADADRTADIFTPWSHGSWVNIFYESNSWEYSLYVPHDVRGLIQKCGGRQKFVERLDHFFDRGHYNINNEPGFLTPCLYIYAGQHHRTLERINAILRDNYTAAADGLPGNDDSGAMSSWYVFHKAGLFPVAGQDVYLLTAPHFDRIELNTGNGHSAVITARNSGGNNIYVKSVKVNGEPWHKPWISHAELADGACIEFTMDSRPSEWFGDNLPPSM